jgi:dethiobiotin synthetase
MKRLRLPARLFVTGTGTGVGKTIVSAILMAGTRGVYWKPVQSGLEEITDTQWIQRVTGLSEHHFQPERHRLRQALSPHASAALDGVRIDLADFELPDPTPFDHLIVEGAGGLLVPLNRHDFVIDLIGKLGLPVLLVASSGLGTINHTLLSLDQLRRRKVTIAGVILNGPRNASNREAIEHYGRAAVAEIEPQARISSGLLAQLFASNFREEI